MAELIKKIIECNVKKLSVIGLAKNTGKTVTFNTIVKECLGSGIKPALVSFGRDGEAVDAITLLEKPRIKVPPHTYFVTAERFINPAVIDIEDEISTGLFTVFGETKIYSSGASGGMAELIGINKLKTLSAVLPVLEKHSDIILIDGALDRRSSAVPAYSDAAVIATGAVLGMTEADVIQKTDEAIARFRIPELIDDELIQLSGSIFSAGLSGCITESGNIIKFESSETAFQHAVKNFDVSHLILTGAITDSRIEQLKKAVSERKIQIIIKDGTRVFLGKKYLNRVFTGEINMNVFDSINIIAVTVNPTRPFYADMDSEKLVAGIRSIYPEYLCYDILSEEYAVFKNS